MIEKIKQMVADGIAAQKIAVMINMDVKKLRQIIQDNKFELQHEQFSEDKIEHIINLYKQGVSAKTIGLKYSISKLRVQKWVEADGNLRSREDSHRVVFFNQQAFDTLNTSEATPE